MTELVKEEMNTDGNNIGSINISPDVIASIASDAAANVAGIAGLSSGMVDNISEKMGLKNQTKGIKIDWTEEELNIDVFVLVEHGIAIDKVSQETQKAVKAAVEKTTGLECSNVNIHVQGIVSPTISDVEE